MICGTVGKPASEICVQVGDQDGNLAAAAKMKMSFFEGQTFIKITLKWSEPKRKQTKRVLTNIYYSPQSKSSISLGGWSRYKTLRRFSSWKFSMYILFSGYKPN